ncbi:MAG: hypothetical protein ACE5KD_02850 [Candidatus Bathyarchaeia archaeon]
MKLSYPIYLRRQGARLVVRMDAKPRPRSILVQIQDGEGEWGEVATCLSLQKDALIQAGFPYVTTDSDGQFA